MDIVSMKCKNFYPWTNKFGREDYGHERENGRIKNRHGITGLCVPGNNLNFRFQHLSRKQISKIIQEWWGRRSYNPPPSVGHP